MNILNELNPKQREAVETTEGPLLVLAGAGTGKTKVLTYRIAHIIGSGLAQPSQILSVTFTNKAAREMQERVTKLIDTSGITLGTFHACAAKILRAHAELCNLTSSFSIIGMDDQVKLIKEILLEFNIDAETAPPKIIGAIISKWKDMALVPEKVSQSDIKSNYHNIARNVYKTYQSKLVESNTLDFGDLILYNVQIFLQNPDILEHYQNKYKYILIDEYQDTNPVQYIWTRMLASKYNNICCVGDDDQSIYSWRGAEIGNILKFEKDFKDSKIIKLEQNYRSTSAILKVASRLINCNKHRHGKELWTEDGEGKAVKIVYCWNDKEEARFVVSEIQMRLKAGVIQPSDIAILVRAGFQTRMFEEALISLAIPYKIIGGFKFYERAEIRDAISYIRASINHGDNIALERIINTPKRSVGASTIAAIKSYANQNNISTFAAIKQMIEHNLFKPRIHSSLEFLINKLEEWNNVYSIMNLYESTKKILEESGYMAMLKEENTDEANARMENLREMLRAMNDFQTIEAFLEHASLVTDGDLKGAVENAISLMTVHAAKGLEFDLVFLPGFEDGLFPHQKSIADDGPKGLEEERRLAYVGITRAKNELYISYAQSRRIYNEFVASIPSRFIEEILGDGVEKIASSVHYSKKVTIPSPAPQASNNTKATGIYVNHSIFGKGVIIRRDGDSVEVAFADHGIKKLKEQYLVPCD